MTFPKGAFETGQEVGQAIEQNENVANAAASEGEFPSSQRRQHPRRLTSIRCWISDQVHTAYLRMHDISLGGLSVGAPLPFAPNSEIELRIELPGGRQVRARGCVVWRKEMRLGARFVEILAGQSDLDAWCSESAS